jgi:molecular chaperone DnaK (HSP70)
LASPGDWVLAIDFGTTNTVAAVTDERGTNTLMVDGKQVTPSAVFLNPDRKTWSVGNTAIRIAKVTCSFASMMPGPPE